MKCSPEFPQVSTVQTRCRVCQGNLLEDRCCLVARSLYWAAAAVLLSLSCSKHHWFALPTWQLTAVTVLAPMCHCHIASNYWQCACATAWLHFWLCIKLAAILPLVLLSYGLCNCMLPYRFATALLPLLCWQCHAANTLLNDKCTELLPVVTSLVCETQ